MQNFIEGHAQSNSNNENYNESTIKQKGKK